MSVTAATDAAELVAARRGDEAAFEQLVEPYRGELHAHCYRMLGSLHDTEDAMQEAMLRAWRGLEGFDGSGSLRAWLYRIATNTSLDILARRKRRLLPVEYAPAADPAAALPDPVLEPVWLEPYPDQVLAVEDGYASPDARYERRESLELAFVAALQHLPPRQRAVLILRQVLGFSAKEVAEVLDTSVPSVNSALQRARATLERRAPERSQQATLRALGDAGTRQLVERFTEAMGSADIERVVSMLTDDVTWSMPPLPTWYRGLGPVADFLQLAIGGERSWRRIPTTASGQLAVGCYIWHEQERTHVPFCLDVLTVEGDRIAAVEAFVVRAIEDPGGCAEWPDRALDPDRARDVFGALNLPGQID